MLRASTSLDLLADLDVVLIAVPTPLKDDRQPDLRYVQAATRDIAAGSTPGMLVILQSTCSPGTTREVMLPTLEADGPGSGQGLLPGLRPGADRPRQRALQRQQHAEAGRRHDARLHGAGPGLYRYFVDELVPVSSPEVAETSKLVENTFRFINISFVNEIAQLCDRIGI